MADMDVDIVDVDRKMWSGKATFLFTRTTVGEIGILPRHIPLVAELVPDAVVRVEREGEEDLRIATHGGFLSVTEEGITVLAESAEFASEIDESTARNDAQSDDPQCRGTRTSPIARPRRDRLVGAAADERAHGVHGRVGLPAVPGRRRAQLPALETTSGWHRGHLARQPRRWRPRLAARCNSLPRW